MSLSLECRFCGEVINTPITEEDLQAWSSPMRPPIQNAMPHIPAEFREMLISGLCPECWDKMMKDSEEEESGDEKLNWEREGGE